MAAEAETTTVETFHSPNCHMALKPDGRFRIAEALSRNNNFALEAFARCECLFGDAIESFAAEILRGALDRWSSGLAEQTHRPVQCYPLAFAAITR